MLFHHQGCKLAQKGGTLTDGHFGCDCCPDWAKESGLSLHLMELTHCGEETGNLKTNIQGPEPCPELKSSKTSFAHTYSSWHTPFKVSCDRDCVAGLLPPEK